MRPDAHKMRLKSEVSVQRYESARMPGAYAVARRQKNCLAVSTRMGLGVLKSMLDKTLPADTQACPLCTGHRCT